MGKLIVIDGTDGSRKRNTNETFRDQFTEKKYKL